MSQVAEQREGMPAILKDSAFQWADPLDLEGQLSEEERLVRDTARGFAQDYLAPRIVEAYREEKYDPTILLEMGKLGLIGPTIPEDLWRRRARLCLLRADRARAGTRRQWLPLDYVGAVLAGDVSDLCLWLGGAAAQISAQARDRRADRLLRPDRARPRLRSRLDGDARRESARRLPPQRRQDLDFQRADRRFRRGVGQARRRHPRLHR